MAQKARLKGLGILNSAIAFSFAAQVGTVDKTYPDHCSHTKTVRT
jgi:hypothetical protein